MQMDTLASILAKRAEIAVIASKHGATNVRIFGSIARNDAGPDSDLDLLVDLGPRHSPWFPVRLINDLKQLLNRNIDVVTERSLHPKLREQILREAIRL
ncbi:MAG TPA: nucleotidyltransferase domain-containing protein [Candidatus Kapabacteria bacterium]|nr:nucleotidyltransferase domain-containing protein [Candidatus Kapabacteria bacterium]